MKNIIYTLTDPLTNEIRYVGKTTEKNYLNRYKSHRNTNIKSHGNLHKNNWVMSLKKNNQTPIMEIIDVIEGEWEWLEKYWISQLRTWGFNLLNISEGGDNTPINKGHNSESKIKMRNIRNDIKKLEVKNYETQEVIGIFDGVNYFIKEYLKIDRYSDKKKFRNWSSKISAIANKTPLVDKNGRKYSPRKSYMNLTFNYVS